ncbi:amidohydrolase family protein [Bacillus solitudinis]|uniref:hypothetical protein n=1 Tax=Bacillus solitudinis TaxID=2014074 RepID=UPI000C233927|nr:hypothetical protein [Bacillus solitudinis]
MFDDTFTEEQQWEKNHAFDIDMTILRPALIHSLEEVKKQHNDIAKLSELYPFTFVGVANPNPHLQDQVYETEVRRCIK